MTVVRVKGSAGYLDLTKVGPVGPTGYDSSPIGTIITWSGKSVPTMYALANGQRLTQATFPDGYAFAKQESDAGNTLWTYRTSDLTFTVPNLADRFLYSSGTKPFGAVSTPGGATYNGEETHALGTTELPAHLHSVSIQSGNTDTNHYHTGTTGARDRSQAHAHTDNAGYAFVTQQGANGGATVSIASPGGYKLSSTTSSNDPADHLHGFQTSWQSDTYATNNHSHSVTGNTGNGPGTGVSHNNMPPYVVIALLVKLAGVAALPTSITGPMGPQGPVGPAGPTGAAGPIGPPGNNATVAMDIWHSVGAAGEPAFQNSWANLALPSPPLRFRKDPTGRVYITGVVTGGANGTVIFTLPAGYRPPAAYSYTLDNLQTNGTAGTWIGVVGSSGAVQGNFTGATLYIDVSFDTETVTNFPTGPKGDPGPAGGAANRIRSVYSVTQGYTADRVFNPQSTTVNELASVLGTLIDDLTTAGLIGP